MAKALKRCTLFALAMALQGIYPRDIISFIHKDLCAKNVLAASVLEKRERERTKCPK